MEVPKAIASTLGALQDICGHSLAGSLSGSHRPFSQSDAWKPIQKSRGEILGLLMGKAGINGGNGLAPPPNVCKEELIPGCGRHSRNFGRCLSGTLGRVLGKFTIRGVNIPERQSESIRVAGRSNQRQLSRVTMSHLMNRTTRAPCALCRIKEITLITLDGEHGAESIDRL